MTHLIGGLPEPVLTNVYVYRMIAREALAASEAWDNEHVRRTDGGGIVTVFDPTHTSFKHSLVAIVFAGMVIEATMWIAGCRKLGVNKYEDVDSMKLEDRLQLLGIADTSLRDALRAYRETRRALVHEKALPVSQDRSPNSFGQQEAKKAIRLMDQVSALLPINS